MRTDYPTWISTLGGEAHIYANASNAYKDLLSFLRAVSGRTRANVVIPTYLPAKLHRASLAAGCSVRFYELDESCAPDLGSLEALVDHETVAVLAVHYYGFPRLIDEVAEITRRRGAFLVEDCSHTLGGMHDGRPLGTIGDAAIFSMRKMLLYSEGGVLRVGAGLHDFCPRYERRVVSAWSLQHFLRQRAKGLYVRASRGADPLHLFRTNPVDTMDALGAQHLTVKLPSRFTERRLRYSDVERAIERRRAAYRFLAERFPRTPRFELLHPILPEGVTPSGLPLMVRDGMRDEVRAELLRRGIVTGAGWPESPFDPSHRRATVLARGLLELPVHQALTQAQLDRTLRAMIELAREPSRSARSGGTGRERVARTEGPSGASRFIDSR